MKSSKIIISIRKIFLGFQVLLFLFPFNNIKAQADPPILKVHYLGHSAFVLEFDNGITVVTDYGEPNAWVQWGWNSPIHDIGDLIPTVMTYSHTHHGDHYDPTRIPAGVEYILKENDSLSLNGLEISPIRVCESNINVEDNTAFLFSYKGFKFLHLGDAQAQIININNPAVRDHIQGIIPDSLDLLFMTIEGPTQFIGEAEAFVDLLDPKRIIPMHYWSEEYLQQFIDYLTMQNDSGKTYNIFQLNGSKYEIKESDQPQPVEVITLIRSPYSTTGIKNDEITYGYKLEQNHPNPFNPITTIEFELPVRGSVELSVFNLLGEEVARILNTELNAGYHEVKFKASGISSGTYFYKIKAGTFWEVKKMSLMK